MFGEMDKNVWKPIVTPAWSILADKQRVAMNEWFLASSCGSQKPSLRVVLGEPDWEQWQASEPQAGASRAAGDRRLQVLAQVFCWLFGLGGDPWLFRPFLFPSGIRSASLVAQRLKRLSPMLETWVWSLGQEDHLEKEMATHSSILVWRIPKDIGAWQALVHGVTKELDKNYQLKNNNYIYVCVCASYAYNI